MQNNSNQSHSKRNTFITTVIAVIGFIAANFTDRFLLLFISFNEIHTNVLILAGILQVLGNILLAALIARYLYKSIVDLRRDGPNKKNIVSTSFGALIFITIIGGQIMSAVAFQTAHNYFITSRAETMDRLKATLNPNLAPLRLAKLSFLSAQQTYEFYGTIIEYTTEEGKSKKFEPTDESRKNRSFIIMSELYFRLEPKIRIIATVIWSLFALGTLFLVFFKPNTKDPTITV